MADQQQKKRIAIFGSTGSIGKQTLDVIRDHRDLFSAEILTAQQNDELLVKQAIEFQPNIVVIGDQRKYQKVKEALAAHPVKVFAGEQALEEVAAMDCYDMMLAANVAYFGWELDRETTIRQRESRALAAVPVTAQRLQLLEELPQPPSIRTAPPEPVVMPAPVTASPESELVTELPPITVPDTAPVVITYSCVLIACSSASRALS